MIKDKKKIFFTGKLNENIGKPKELWKSLKSLGLPSKKSSCSTICLEKDGILSFDPKANAGGGGGGGGVQPNTKLVFLLNGESCYYYYYYKQIFYL